MQRFFLLVMLTSVSFLLASGLESQLHSDYRDGIPKLEFVAKGPIGDVNASAEQKAQTYLEMEARSYLLPHDLNNLTLVKTAESLLGLHFHYEQNIGGIKVKRAEIIVSISKQTGEVYMVYNNTYPEMTKKSALDQKPGLLTEDAYDIAWQNLKVHGELLQKPMVELKWIPSETGEFTLVYETVLGVEAPFGYWEHQIDAKTGVILDVQYAAVSEREIEFQFGDYDGPITDRCLAKRLLDFT